MRFEFHVIVATTMLLAAVHCASAREIEKSKERKFPPISITIQPPKKPVTVGKRFAFQIKIRNRSDGYVNLPKPNTINSFFRTWSRNPDSSELVVKHIGPSLGHGFYHGGNMKPGEEMTVELWHVFLDAGTQHLNCVLDTSGLKGENPWKIWEGRIECHAIVSVEGYNDN